MAGLYIHIPYCHSKCSYCDFFSTPRTETLEEYVNALVGEMEMRIQEIPNEQFSTVYIGGGTPSILPVNLLEKIVIALSRHVNIENLDEFTIEANPEDITAGWSRTVSSMGISRVSMGIQSFNDDELRAINRRHSAQTAINAINILRLTGITKISGDLIYGLPLQSHDSWLQSLNTLLSFKLPHFSAYLLYYEHGTRLYAQLMSGKIQETSEDLAQKMYNTLIEMACCKGYEHYEISNFSLPGHNAIHNSNYWNDKPYLGLGVSAHSFDGSNRRFNGNNIKQYIENISSNIQYFKIEEESEDERHNDYIIVSLRTAKGVDLDYYKNRWGNICYDNMMNVAKPYLKNGKMQLKDNNLSISEKWLLISDRIMIDFIR